VIEARAERFHDGQEPRVQAEQRRQIAELERTLGRKAYQLEIAGKLVREVDPLMRTSGSERDQWLARRSYESIEN
jgi:hypothetical protein